MRTHVVKRLVISTAGVLIVALAFAFSSMAWAGEGEGDAANLTAAKLVATQAQDLPSKFDLRAVDYDGDGKDVRCFVTPVRSQNPYGVCWGFATTAAAETYVLSHQLSDFPDAWKTLNFSEKQLSYFTHWHVDDPNSSQNGEGMYPVKMDSYDDVYTGGSVYLGAHSYAAGVGPTSESRDPLLEYRGKNGTIDERGISYAIDDDWSLPDSYREMYDYVLKESYYLPPAYTTTAAGVYQYNSEATQAIKEQLYNLNAVTIGFAADVSRPWAEQSKLGDYMSAETWAHFTWKYDMPNHAVTIIGWDDNYPKENFKNKYTDLPADKQPAGYCTPEGNGAWLVRNSWGAGTNEFPDKNTGQWGIPATDENGDPIYLTDSEGKPVVDEKGNPIPAGSGYFWLSYYDRSIMEPEVLIFDTEITTPGTWPYDQSTLHRDQYDLMPVTGTAHVVSELTKSANVFTSEEGEHVVALSYETVADDTTVTYEIYLLSNGFTSPVDGKLVAKGSQTHKYKGFYMAYPEEAPIILQPGQSYSIVLSQQCADKSYRVNAPASMGENADMVKNGTIKSYAKSVMNPGESFIFLNGEWQDWSLAVVRTQLIPDVPPEMAAIMGNMDYQYDNFPIKGYAFAAPEGAWDAHVRLAGDAENVIVCKDGTTTVELEFYGPEADKVNPDTNPVVWELLEGSEEFVELAPSDSTTTKLTWKKPGNARVYAYVLGVGSLVIPVHVSQIGHDWGETTYAWADDNSTCTASRTCKACGEVESETVEATSAVTKEPTTSEAGVQTLTAEFKAEWAQTQTKEVEIPMLIRYSFTAGDGASWTKGGSTGLTFAVKRSSNDNETFGRFTGVTVDGTALDASSYDAKAGSLVLTLPSTYLGTLAIGEHTIVVKFDDGSADATFKVVDSRSEPSGDDGSKSDGASSDSSSAAAPAKEVDGRSKSGSAKPDSSSAAAPTKVVKSQSKPSGSTSNSSSTPRTGDSVSGFVSVIAVVAACALAVGALALFLARRKRDEHVR